MIKLIELKEMIDKVHRDDNEDPEKNWMINHAKTSEVAEFIGNSSLFTHSELEILTDLAKSNESVLFKTLQENSELSQGMLSRYIARLAKKGLVEKFHSKGNKKSILLKTTSTGREIGELHQELHKAQDRKYEKLLNRYSDDDITTVMKFLNDVINTRKEM